MKIKIIILLIALIAALLLFSCQVNDNINNPIDNGIIASETKWKLNVTTNERLVKIYFKQFDVDGNLVKMNEFNEQGGLFIESLFDINGTEVSEVTSYYNAFGMVDSVSFYTYLNDNKGNTLTQFRFNASGDTISICSYFYNARGNLIKKEVHAPDGFLISKIVYSYTYDDSGNLSKRLTNPLDDGSYQTKDSLIYNNSTKTIELVNFNSSGEVEKIFTYVYNSSGKPVLEIISSRNGFVQSKYLYDYTYFK